MPGYLRIVDQKNTELLKYSYIDEEIESKNFKRKYNALMPTILWSQEIVIYLFSKWRRLVARISLAFHDDSPFSMARGLKRVKGTK